MKKKILYTSQNLLNGPLFLAAEQLLKIKMIVVLEWLAILQSTILGHHIKIMQGKDIHWNNQTNILKKKLNLRKIIIFPRSYSTLVRTLVPGKIKHRPNQKIGNLYFWFLLNHGNYQLLCPKYDFFRLIFILFGALDDYLISSTWHLFVSWAVRIPSVRMKKKHGPCPSELTNNFTATVCSTK